MGQPHDDERLADWVDGRMSERDGERFEAELRADPELGGAAEEYRRFVGRLREALRGDEEPAPDLTDRIMADVGVRRSRRFTPFAGSLLAAAAIVAVFFALRALPDSPAPDTTSSARAPAAASAEKRVAANGAEWGRGESDRKDTQSGALADARDVEFGARRPAGETSEVDGAGRLAFELADDQAATGAVPAREPETVLEALDTLEEFEQVAPTTEIEESEVDRAKRFAKATADAPTDQASDLDVGIAERVKRRDALDPAPGRPADDDAGPATGDTRESAVREAESVPVIVFELAADRLVELEKKLGVNARGRSDLTAGRSLDVPARAEAFAVFSQQLVRTPLAQQYEAREDAPRLRLGRLRAEDAEQDPDPSSEPLGDRAAAFTITSGDDGAETRTGSGDYVAQPGDQLFEVVGTGAEIGAYLKRLAELGVQNQAQVLNQQVAVGEPGVLGRFEFLPLAEFEARAEPRARRSNEGKADRGAKKRELEEQLARVQRVLVVVRPQQQR